MNACLSADGNPKSLYSYPHAPIIPFPKRLRSDVQPQGLKRHLSWSDALRCLELIHQTLDCKDSQSLSTLLGEVGSLIEAEYCACLLNSKDPLQESDRILIVDGTFPAEWLALYGERQFHLIDPIVAENFSRFSLQYWSDTYKKAPPPKTFRYLAEDFGLNTGFSYGIRDEHGTGGSLFSFSGPKLKGHPRNYVVLDQVLPHLHRVLTQLESGVPPRGPKTPLTGRELEVLKWIGVGKSSWATSVILRISERTVNFHINNILRKLDAVNRPQAVAIAVRFGLLELP